MNSISESIRLMDLHGYLAFDKLARQLSVMGLMEQLANPWIWMPLLAAISTIFLSTQEARRRHTWAAFFGICAWFLSIQLSDLLAGFVFQQPSPEAWLAVAGNHLVPQNPYSMPDWFVASLSGYLTFTMAKLPIGKKWHRIAFWLAVLPLVCTARVCAGAAFPSHVFVGWVTGQLIALLFLLFFHNFRIVMLKESV